MDKDKNYNITINTEGGFGGDMDKFAREIIFDIKKARKAELPSAEKKLIEVKEKFWKRELKKLKQRLAKFKIKRSPKL